MSSTSPIHVALDQRGVATLTLQRPEKRNALNAPMIEALTDFAQHLDPRVRVVVLSGAGALFCAGGDLDWMQAQITADRSTRKREARTLAMMLKALNEMPVPLIGRLHGAAMGGGVGMACVCDVAIAASDTRFGLTETRLGLIPATIAPYVVARMGEGAARQVLMSGRVFNAPEAVRLGIIARAVDANDLDAHIDAEIAPYLDTAPHAVATAKRLARAMGPQIDADTIEHSIEALAQVWEHPEALEGVSAFLEKRKPLWGR